MMLKFSIKFKTIPLNADEYNLVDVIRLFLDMMEMFKLFKICPTFY